MSKISERICLLSLVAGAAAAGPALADTASVNVQNQQGSLTLQYQLDQPRKSLGLSPALILNAELPPGYVVMGHSVQRTDQKAFRQLTLELDQEDLMQPWHKPVLVADRHSLVFDSELVRPVDPGLPVVDVKASGTPMQISADQQPVFIKSGSWVSHSQSEYVLHHQPGLGDEVSKMAVRLLPQLIDFMEETFHQQAEQPLQVYLVKDGLNHFALRQSGSQILLVVPADLSGAEQEGAFRLWLAEGVARVWMNHLNHLQGPEWLMSGSAEYLGVKALQSLYEMDIKQYEKQVSATAEQCTFLSQTETPLNQVQGLRAQKCGAFVHYSVDHKAGKALSLAAIARMTSKGTHQYNQDDWMSSISFELKQHKWFLKKLTGFTTEPVSHHALKAVSSLGWKLKKYGETDYHYFNSLYLEHLLASDCQDPRVQYRNGHYELTGGLCTSFSAGVISSPSGKLRLSKDKKLFHALKKASYQSGALELTVAGQTQKLMPEAPLDGNIEPFRLKF